MDYKRAHISWLFLLIFILTASVSPLRQDGMVAAVGRKGVEAIKELRDRLTARRLLREEARQSNREVCYDIVGCFIKPLKPSPLKKFPESPEDVGTKFLLFTRTNGSYNPDKEKFVEDAQILINGDSSQSLSTSDFNPRKGLKMLIHGFKGKGQDKSVIIAVNALLKLDDENIVVVDWEKGAAGPSYTQAVANTELVGRQTALILLDMINLGLQPANIHLIGFSLGAHIAGCAAYIVEYHTGKKVGRITGLDPASPIFRRNILLDLHRKLDANDAEFVDVIHTDGSPVWTNGFGLLQPIGHVDFFPNGGQEQPGCTDGRASVVVSHFDGNLDINSACSHLRAWRFFLESVVNHDGACQFKAYPCHPDFPNIMKGNCFPSLEKCADGDSDSCGIMGIRAQKSKARGPLYLVTRASIPYCGEQLRATVLISEKTQRTRGILYLTLQHGNQTTNFQINCEYSLLDVVQGGRMMWGLAAAGYGSIEPKTTPTIKGKLAYRSLSFQAPTSSEENSDISLSSDIYLDQVSVTDTHGNNWHYCGKDTLLQDKRNYAFDEVKIILSLSPCLS